MMVDISFKYTVTEELFSFKALTLFFFNRRGSWEKIHLFNFKSFTLFAFQDLPRRSIIY